MKRRKFLENTLIATSTWSIRNHINLDKFMDKDIYEINLGSARCVIFRDLMFSYKASDYFINADSKELSKSLKQYSLQPDQIASPFIALLIETETKKILVDTGSGYSKSPITFRGKTFPLKGKLKSLLPHAGITAEDITDVVITHFHPDHIGGIFTENKINYPNAKFHIHQEEWDYWNSSKSDNENPLFKYFVEKNISPLSNHDLNLISGDEQELYHGITSIQAPGHTPGQIGILLESNNKSLLYTSDSFLHPLHIERLDWKTNYDKDHEEAKKSREKLLSISKNEDALINSFHFDFPGIGRAEKHKDNWIWLANE